MSIRCFLTPLATRSDEDVAAALFVEKYSRTCMHVMRRRGRATCQHAIAPHSALRVLCLLLHNGKGIQGLSNYIIEKGREREGIEKEREIERYRKRERESKRAR